MVGRLKGGHNLELKIKLITDEEIKLDLDDELTVLMLKDAIYEEKDILAKQHMCLMWAGVKLENQKKLKDYKMKSGSVII